MRPDISVILPTYNREEVLIDTIHELLDNQTHANFELLVIDQTKKHDAKTAKALTTIDDSRYRYIQADPPSLPAARNLGLQLAKSPIALYLDDDIVPDKDLIKWHLRTFQEKPNISAVGGRVLQDGFPIKRDVLRFDDFAISHGVFTASQAAYTNAFPGGNCALRVDDALSVGGFDCRYRGNAFREESDMSLKLTRAGKKIYFQPKASILHLAAPYGGLRVSGHIYDSKTFYKNELFFTLRAVRPKNLYRALSKKYDEYCNVPSRRQRLRRSGYFISGLLTAGWWRIFGRQLKSIERAK